MSKHILPTRDRSGKTETNQDWRERVKAVKERGKAERDRERIERGKEAAQAILREIQKNGLPSGSQGWRPNEQAVMITRYFIRRNRAFDSKVKLVALALADRANYLKAKEGPMAYCFPGEATIAADCGMSVRSVKRAISMLLKSGLIELVASAEYPRKRKWRKGKMRCNEGRQTNGYKLLWLIGQSWEY